MSALRFRLRSFASAIHASPVGVRTARSACASGAVLVLAYAVACAPPRAAAPSDDRTLLIGTWELVSFSRRLPDGRIVAPWGARPAGQLTYDTAGRVTALLMHEQRNEAAGTPSPPAVEAEYSAYFGTFAVDRERRIVIHRVTGSLSAARAARELQRAYEFRDGQLVLSFRRAREGSGPETNVLVWRRVPAPAP